MKLKSLLIAGAVAAAFMAPEYATARPKPHKPKPDLTDKKDDAKEDAKEGGKESPKVDREKIKVRLKAAFESAKSITRMPRARGTRSSIKAEPSANWFAMTTRSRNCAKPSRQLPRNIMKR